MLDRETEASYKLTVSVADHGEPSNTATAVVYVKVNDLNDNPPIFSQSLQYHVSVMEEQNPGDFVAQLIATDLDNGENARITYSFLRGKFLYFL